MDLSVHVLRDGGWQMAGGQGPDELTRAGQAPMLLGLMCGPEAA